MNVDLLPYQMDFLQADEEELAFVGGVGTGKTYTGALFAITETANFPNIPGIIVASTYGQLQSATLVHLKNLCTKLSIPYKYNSQKQTVIVNQTEHFVRSSELYDNSRGIEGGWLWVDEAAYSSQESIDMFLGRIRYNGGSFKKRYTSTPNGFNWMYQRFAPEGEEFSTARKMIKAKTEDNYLLAPSYVRHLRSTYSSQLAAQELDADFLSFAGSRAYNDFNQKLHVHDLFQPPTIQDQIFIVHDLNIDPLAGVCCFQRNGVIYVFDEIFMEGGADMRMLATEIKKRQYHMPRVIGDGATNNRRSSWNIKDTAYKILNEAGLPTIPFINPHVAKRIANVNRLFYHSRIVIHPKCKNLINDLNLVKYKQTANGNELDKTTNKKLTHISDALGYAAWYFQPWEEHQQKSKSYSY